MTDQMPDRVDQPEDNRDLLDMFLDWSFRGPQNRSAYGNIARFFLGSFWTLAAVAAVYFTLVVLSEGDFLGSVIGFIVSWLIVSYAWRIWTWRAHWLAFFI